MLFFSWLYSRSISNIIYLLLMQYRVGGKAKSTIGIYFAPNESLHWIFIPLRFIKTSELRR